MSKPILLHMHFSPPSRFAFITAIQIGLDVEVRNVDMFNGEHKTPEYKAVNPTSTVPALIDGEVNVFDSSAIAIYLVEKYAKDDSLYPKDLILRTKVNEKLFYVSSYIFARTFQIFVGGYYSNETEVPQKKIDEMLRGYQTVEVFLTGNDYLAGNSLSLADLSLWTIMESLHQVIPIDEDKFPNFTRWLETMRKLETYAENKQGADGHIAFYRSCIAKTMAEKEQ